MTRRWKLTAAGAAAALVAAFTVAAIVDGSDPDATPAAAAAGSVAGVHVLSQAGSFAPTTSQAVSAIASQQSGLRTAMAFPGVNHYGVRVGWSAVETSAGVFDPAVFNRALQVITGSSDPAVNGDRLTVRIMAGRSTPARYLSGANACPTVTASNGTRAPAPFTRVGSSLVTNTCFVDAERRIMEAITTWALAQGGKVDEIHLSHYGLDWAEFNAGPEIQTIGDGASGFSASEATAMVAATNALVDIGVDLAATNHITYELPMSGKGPIMAATDRKSVV